MNKSLKVAFLWHQHQPYYKMNNEFILPWVLLHGTKDYFDLPEVLYEFPNIKQTFNFAPSLNLQIDDYVRSKGTDKIRVLTAKNAKELTEEDKTEILKFFFHSNFENMIKPNPRFFELYNLVINDTNAVTNLHEQEWRDLQMWYNLSWFGYYSSQSGLINRLRLKGRDYTEDEKILMMQEQNFLLAKIVNQYKKLRDLQQIEISCSPMYHPILPLLCDSRSALEANPDNILPVPNYKYPEDAKLQLSSGIDYFASIFGEKPKGMWPSEGSISTEVLNLMIDHNISWFASDELVLEHSVGDTYHKLDKYFPRKFKGKNGEITGFFRDHLLSDKIGFLYSTWNESDAAGDFINYLLSIRENIINHYGEAALSNAVVPVILDGENCWEFYKDNGIPFLRELFLRLDKSEFLNTVTFNEVVIQSNSGKFLPPLTTVRAGSWINANFNIWIGHEDDIKAWNVLSKARATFESMRQNLDSNLEREILNEIMIAEGSDWFWWYGPEHHTENKPEFDLLFRHHVSRIYELLKLEIPAELNVPIARHALASGVMKPLHDITPDLNLSPISESWRSCGNIDLNPNNTSMHKSGSVIDTFKYAYDKYKLYFGIKLSENSSDFVLKIIFENRVEIRYFRKNNFTKIELDNINEINIYNKYNYFNISVQIDKIMHNEKLFNLRIIIESAGETVQIPKYGYMEL
jgi:alpha-amylase/alpha-mannosidase (GH57 family)